MRNLRNDINGQLKIRSEARFPVKGSRTSPLHSSRLRVEVLNYLLVEMKNGQVRKMNMMQAMNSKCKRSKKYKCKK